MQTITNNPTTSKPILNMTAHLKAADEKFFAMPLPEYATAPTAPVAPVAEEWPVCLSCGRGYAAWDEEGTMPDTSCWWCDKHANG